MATDPKVELRENVLRVIDEEAKGFVVVGVVQDDGQIETRATVQSLSVGDLAVAVSGVVTRVVAQNPKKK